MGVSGHAKLSLQRPLNSVMLTAGLGAQSGEDGRRRDVRARSTNLIGTVASDRQGHKRPSG